jgi:hypothetical protein
MRPRCACRPASAQHNGRKRGRHEHAVDDQDARLDQQRVVEREREPADQCSEVAGAELEQQREREQRHERARQRGHESQQRGRDVVDRPVDRQERLLAAIAAQLDRARDQDLGERRMQLEEVLARRRVRVDHAPEVHFVEHSPSVARRADRSAAER